MKIRHLLLLLLVGLSGLSLQAQDNEEYTYRFKVEPASVCTLTFEEVQWSWWEGATMSLPGVRDLKPGYKLVGWFSSTGDTVSIEYYWSSQYTDYPRPHHDETFTAKFIFAPDLPDLPGLDDTKPRLTLTRRPSNLTNRFELKEPNGHYKYFYPGESVICETDSNYVVMTGSRYSDYSFVGWQDEHGNVVSTEPEFQFQMPNHDITLNAYYRYNPATPTLPDANPYDNEQELLVMDEFTPGELWYDVTDSYQKQKVGDAELTSVIVNGVIADDDLYPHGNYTYIKELRFVDFSRSTGVSTLERYPYTYTYIQNIKEVKFPACIDSLGRGALDYAREDLPALQQITFYSKTPPRLTFQEEIIYDWENLSYDDLGFPIYTPIDTIYHNKTINLPEDVVIRVPATSVSLYRKAAGWGDLTIFPIVDEIVNLTVDFPEGTDMAPYKDMQLEVRNVKSGERSTYIVNGRTRYVFSDIIKRAAYQVSLCNAQGQLFGQSKVLDIQDEDVQLTLGNLATPVTAQLSVVLPESEGGRDITGEVAIQWLDAKGNMMGSGARLEGLADSTMAYARVTLPSAMLTQYVQPAQQEWEVTADNARHQLVLQPIAVMQLKGRVVSAVDKKALADAVVTATQRINGVTNSVSTIADKQGYYTLQLKQAEAVITYSSRRYIAQTDTLDASSLTQIEVTQDDVALDEMAGSIITLNLMEQNLADVDEEWEVKNLLSVPDNMTLQVMIGDKPTKEFSLDYPRVIMRQNLADGTEVTLTLSSTDDTFAPVTSSTGIFADRGEVYATFIPHGALKATFKKTFNSKVVGMLFDSSGNLVTIAPFDNKATLTVNNLKDGVYQLIGMGECMYLNAFQTLEQLRNAGLTPDKDYAIQAVTVRGGQTSFADLSFIPVIAENKFHFTGDNTKVTLSKTTSIVGCVLTANCKFDFKPVYADKVSNVKVIAELPATAQYINNTMLLGNTAHPHEVDGQRIIVPIEGNSAERLRFCFTPTAQGNCNPAFYVQFTMDGIEMTQPIGAPTCNVENLYLRVEETVVEPELTVFGMGPAGSQVRVMVNEVELARTTVKLDGEWTAKVDLGNPYNMQTFSVRADLTSPEGLELSSKLLTTTYDSTLVVPVYVDMNYLNNYYRKVFNVRFDLVNKTVSPKSHGFYDETDFTFVVGLSRPEKEFVKSIDLLVYTTKGKWEEIPVSYNDSLQQWMGVARFNADRLPTSVSVRVHTPTGRVMGGEPLDNVFDNLYTLGEDNVSKELNQLQSDLHTYMGDDYTIEELRMQLDRMAELLGFSIDRTGWDYSTIPTREQLLADSLRVEQMLAESPLLDSNLDHFDLTQMGDAAQYLQNIKIERAEGMTPELLLEQGYEQTQIQGKEGIYTKNDADCYHIFMLDKNLHMTITLDKEMYKTLRRLKAPRKEQSMAELNDQMSVLQDICEKLRVAADALQGAISSVLESIGRNQSDLTDQLIKATQELETMKIKGAGNWDIWTKEWHIGSLKDKMVSNNKIRDWLNKNLNVRSGFGKAIGIFDAVNNAYSYHKDINKLAEAWANVPDPCKEDQANATKLQAMAIGGAIAAAAYFGYNIGSTIASLTGATAGVTAAVPSAGISLVGVAGAIAVAVANYYAGKAYEEGIATLVEIVTFETKDLACFREKPCPKCHKFKCSCKSELPEVVLVLDPSGYVYEGVESNRLEGVTATCYYKETLEDMYGDPYEHIDIWNSEPFGQINPQLTDAQGMYHWDVPQGLWQVRLHKNGYEDTQSEWLPVPPPQLEVNLPMTQNTPPTVASAHAYPTGIEVDFSKHMDADYLTADNIVVTQNGQAVEGEITLLDGEHMGSDTTRLLASHIRFVPDVPYQVGEEVQLFVSRQVKSYAGIRMEQDFLQTFDIEPEMTDLESEREVNVHIGTAKELTIRVLPAEAAAGKQMNISIAGDAARISTTSAILNEQGETTLLVEGMLPGTSVLTYSIPGSKLTATTIISVKNFNSEPPEAPEASIASGAEVELGTGIYLSCMTQGATIYYTLDGSCPCDESHRYRYDGRPIIITDFTEIRAMAVSSDGVESDIEEFKYFLSGQLNGISDQKVRRLIIEPALAENFIDITLPDEEASSNILIVGMDGKCHQKGNTTVGKLRMNVASMPAGVYIVLSMSKTGKAASRFIKK